MTQRSLFLTAGILLSSLLAAWAFGAWNPPHHATRPNLASDSKADIGPESVPLEIESKPRELVPHEERQKEDPQYANEVELIQAHLGPAPARLQSMAAQLFATQAEHFRTVAEELHGRPPDLETSRLEMDARFAERVRRVAIEKLAAQEGVLVVEGVPYDKAVLGKQHILWAGSQTQLGRSTDVLVIIDPPDAQLLELDAAFRSFRSLVLAEQLTTFNSQPWEDRAAAIRDFQQRQRDPQTRNATEFGVDREMLQWMVIDPQNMTVLPLER